VLTVWGRKDCTVTSVQSLPYEVVGVEGMQFFGSGTQDFPGTSWGEKTSQRCEILYRYSINGVPFTCLSSEERRVFARSLEIEAHNHPHACSCSSVHSLTPHSMQGQERAEWRTAPTAHLVCKVGSGALGLAFRVRG
jgi:hypothetical protein